MGLQWIGAILIVAGCGGIGFLMALYDRRELEGMRQLIAALDFMHCELSYRLTPLPELCRKVSGQCKGGLRAAFCALAEELDNQISPDVACCMHAALSRVPDLPAKVKAAVSELGTTLGQFDLEGQIRGLESVRQTCADICRTMEDGRPQRLRSYQTLGLCAGAALVILFI